MFWVGSFLSSALGLVVPGGILGLFLLLALLGTRLIKLTWIEPAAEFILALLPLLLLPAFVGAARDHTFWREIGLLYIGAIVASLFCFWICLGHFAQWLFRVFPPPADDPGPLTEAEQTRAAQEASEEEAMP